MAQKLDAAATGTTTLDAGRLGTVGLADANSDVANLTFEQARDELSQVVARLEAGGEPLEGALALWERGEALAAHCQVWLDDARARFEAITGTNDAPASGANNYDAVPF